MSSSAPTGARCARAARPAASKPGLPCRAWQARLAALGPDDTAERDTILREAGRRLGIALAPVVGALDLAEIVLSGPTELLDGPLATAAIETLRNADDGPVPRGDLTLRMTTLGEDIVMRGAAVMVLSGQLGVS